MPRAKPRTRRSGARTSVARARPAAPAEPSPPRFDLREEPHAHIVCRSCGRIQRLALTELDRHFLTELAARRPDAWSVDGISYSLTGACQRCREGASA